MDFNQNDVENVSAVRKVTSTPDIFHEEAHQDSGNGPKFLCYHCIFLLLNSCRDSTTLLGVYEIQVRQLRT